MNEKQDMFISDELYYDLYNINEGVIDEVLASVTGDEIAMMKLSTLLYFVRATSEEADFISRLFQLDNKDEAVKAFFDTIFSLTN